MCGVSTTLAALLAEGGILGTLVYVGNSSVDAGMHTKHAKPITIFSLSIPKMIQPDIKDFWNVAPNSKSPKSSPISSPKAVAEDDPAPPLAPPGVWTLGGLLLPIGTP